MHRSTERLWSPNFCGVFLLSLLTSIGFYMTMPTIPKFALTLGMTMAQAGVLTGLFSIVAIFARPIAGLLSDRRNKKRLLLVAYFGMALASVGYSLSTGEMTLCAARIAHGFFFAISGTVQFSFAAELVPPKRTGEGLGYMGTAQILAMSFAPELGLRLVDAYGYHTMFLVSALLVGLSGVAVGFLPYYRPAAEERPASHGLCWRELIAPELLLLAVMGGLFSVMNGVTSAFIALLGEERGIGGISLFFTVASVTVLAIRPLVGRLTDEKGLSFLLIPSFLLGGAAMFLLGSAKGIAAVIVAAILKGVSQSGGQLAVQAECVRRKDAGARGVAISTCYLGNDLGNSFGASFGGWVAGAAGNGSMFAVIGVLMLTGPVMLGVQHRMDRKKSSRGEQTESAA